jgi:hypothetical protein
MGVACNGEVIFLDIDLVRQGSVDDKVLRARRSYQEKGWVTSERGG